MGATLALPFLDAMVPAMSAQAKAAPRFAAIYCRQWRQHDRLDAAHRRRRLRVLADPEAARGRSAIGRLVFTGLDNFPATDQGDVGGQHPRAAPAFMSCAHPEADRRRRRAGRHDDRPNHRRADLPRHQAAVAGTGGRPQRRRRRLRPRLRLRLHELDVVEDADDAAAGGDQPAVRVRADVRQRRHRRRAPGPQPRKIAAFSTA